MLAQSLLHVRMRKPGPVLRRTALLFIILLATGALEIRAQARRGGTLSIGGTIDLRGMNSLVSNEAYTNEFLNNVLFMTLVRFTPTLQLQPYLAKSWTLVGDTAAVFHLRNDVFWHDGVKTTAYDVAWTIQTAINPETAFPNDYFAKWDRVTAVDSFTVRAHFKPSQDPLVGLPFVAIMPKHLLDTIPVARMRNAAFNRHPVGNGPFRFVSYQANSQWVFDANPRFPAAFGGRPYLDRLVWRVIPDNSAQITAVSTGDVDLITAPGARNVKSLDERPDLRAVIKPSRKYVMIEWNGKHPPLNDARVRRALTLALDRKKMIDVLRGGYAEIANGPIAPFHWAYDKTIAPLPYDPAAARTILSRAGLQDRNGDGTLEDASGKPLTVELKIAANNQFNKDVGEMVRSDLQKIGVNVIVRPVDFATLIQDVTSKERNFDGAFMSWESDFEINLRDTFHSSKIDGEFQGASYSNPTLDKLLDQAETTTSRAALRPIWGRVQRILRDDEPWTFLWYTPDLIIINERVKNTTMDLRGIFINVHDWWLAK